MTNNDKIKLIIEKVATMTLSVGKYCDETKFNNSAEWIYWKAKYETLLKVLKTIEHITKEETNA